MQVEVSAFVGGIAFSTRLACCGKCVMALFHMAHRHSTLLQKCALNVPTGLACMLVLCVCLPFYCFYITLMY